MNRRLLRYVEKARQRRALSLALSALTAGLTGFLPVIREVAWIASLLTLRTAALILVAAVAMLATFLASFGRALQIVCEIT